MFTHTLIHVLEFAVCILFVLLFVQIYRGYRKQTQQVQQLAAERAAAAAAQISARARDSILGHRSASSSPQMVRVRVVTEKNPVEKPRLVKDSVSSPEHASSREITPSIKPHSTQAFAKLNAANAGSAAPIKASEILLNDYIGGFFSEPVKAAEIMPFRGVVSESVSVTAKPIPAVSVDASLTQVVECLESPQESAQTELEDDIVITVNAPCDAGNPADRVMSDKVVHAMLDEAKLVCVS